MTHATYRMQKDLSDEFSKRPVNTAALFAIMQVRTARSRRQKYRKNVPFYAPTPLDPPLGGCGGRGFLREAGHRTDFVGHMCKIQICSFVLVHPVETATKTRMTGQTSIDSVKTLKFHGSSFPRSTLVASS